MPQGKQNKTSSNPKKKGNKSRSVSTGAVRGDVGTMGGRHGGTRTALGQLPSLDALYNQRRTGRAPRSLLDNASNSIYRLYKDSTDRIKTSLKSMVPSAIFETDRANSIMEAANYIVANDLEVDQGLLDDLKLAIRIRRQVAKDRYSGGDQGHAYFIASLNYCWSALRWRGKQAKRITRNRPPEEPENVASLNRFEKLSTEDSDSDTKTSDADDDVNVAEVADDEDDESDMPQSPMMRPVETVPSRLTLDELISGDDRTDIILFLMSLDALMQGNALQFQQIKVASATIQKEKFPPSIIVEQMMEASVAANISIQQVASLEKVFMDEHPHLTTVYRMLANLVLVEFVQVLTAIVTKKSPIASQFSEKHAVGFLGDAMECYFRNPSDPHNKSRSLVKDFLERWQFQDDVVSPLAIEGGSSVEQVFQCVQDAVRFEALLPEEHDMFMLVAGQLGIRSHSWLVREYIGRNRSISHTIRLLQRFSHLMQVTHGRIVTKQGFFGAPWRNRKGPATRIQVEMDDLLLGDVMPWLVHICSEGMMSANLLYQDELFSGFVQIKAFVNNPELPVTWSLAFTAHTILTGIFELQGSNDFSFLADTAQRTFQIFMEQLEWAEKTIPTTIPRRPPIWDDNVKLLWALQLLVHVPVAQARDRTTLSVWNPYCAGTFLSYLAYFGNLEGGTTLVDSVAQLRMTLHLFHALKRVKAIRPGRIKLLDSIFKTFKGSKAIWEGPLPTKGQYQTQWWMAFGFEERRARQMSGLPSDASSLHEPLRKLTPVDPEGLSKSFRRICLRDFRDVEDKYHEKKQRLGRRNRGVALYRHVVRVNDTLDAMTADVELLATNLVCLGFYLNQFCIDLFCRLGWMSEVERIVSGTSRENRRERRRGADPNSWEASDENLKYQCMIEMFATKVLLAFDVGDTSVAPACADFMEEYFNGIKADTLMWFTPSLDES